MIKWEHKVEVRPFNLEETKTAVQFLDSHGAEGWELVSMIQTNNTNVFIFKRPITK